MIVLNRNNLKLNNFGMDKSEKEQTANEHHKQDKSEKGHFLKGKTEREQIWKSRIWLRTILNRKKGIMLNRTNLKKDNPEKAKSGREQIWKGNSWLRTTLERNNLKKDNSGKDKSEKGQFWKGKIWKEQFWNGKI